MTASDSSNETLASGGPTGAANTASTASTPGALLRSAREVQGLSIGDVSTRLRMGVRQIDALERGDYAALPTGTFLRGMVRNYAKIVNVDADAAIHLLESTYSHASVSLKDAKIVVPSQNIKVSGRSEFSWARLKWLVLAIVAGAVAFGVWYSWDYIRPYFSGLSGNVRTAGGIAEKTTAVAPPQVQPATSAPVVTAPPQSAPSVPVAPPAAAPTTASVTPAPAAPVAVTPPPALAESSSSSPVGESTKLTPDPAATARPAGSSVLGFTFAGDSWLEVVDGRGRTLISKRFQSGETDEATGRPPFSIVVGNAAKVRMAYNGKEFDLTPHTRANSTVARFTLK